MIHSAQLPCIAALHNSIYLFYLTGSRFFQKYAEGSDWDFFVEDSPGLVEYLESVGFLKSSKGTYASKEILAVYKHREGVDVQIVVNAAAKEKVQQKMLAAGLTPILYATTKAQRSFYWTIAMALVE